MQARRRATAAVLAALTLGVTAAAPALATPEPTTRASADSFKSASKDKKTASKDGASESKDKGTSKDADRAPLTPEQVASQVAEAATLQKQLEKDDKALAAASKKLADLSAASNALISKVAAARAAEDVAKQKEAAELAELKRLTAEVTAAQQDLQDMAYDAYVNGPGLLREVAAVIDIVTTGGESADAAAKAGYLSKARAADQKHFEQLAAQQREAAKKAAAAMAERAKKTAAAEKAQKDAAAAVAEQQASVEAMQKLAGEQRGKLADLGVDAGMIAGVDLASLEKVVTTPLCTEENTSYPNGQWPGTALCPLASASGHMLRPSAARAFDALAEAYQKANGTNLCITDSYRSLAAQIDVKRRKPVLAAKPGTSNHGLGKAVDLCGGIESFGTSQHIWMQQHAPLFGFFHPDWAQADGSKPEPWHWEFAG